MSKKSEAYSYLKSRIQQGYFTPGSAISEAEIANTLKMSRTPVREAFRDLENNGLVISYPDRGTFVTELSFDDIQEVYELRCLLEEWALERSFLRITEEELNDFEKKFIEGYKEKNWEKTHLADKEFHNLFVIKSGSRRIQDFLSILNSQIERVRRISAIYTLRRELSIKEHLEIISCLQKKDLKKAKDALHNHLHSVAESTRDVLYSYGNIDKIKTEIKGENVQ